MRQFWRIIRLTTAYPGRFAAYVALSVFIGAMGAGFVALLYAILEMLSAVGEGGARIGDLGWNVPEALRDAPVVGAWARAGFAWFAGLTVREAFGGLIALGFAMFSVNCAAEFGRRYLSGWLRGRVVRDTQARLARHLLHLDLAFFQSQRQGEIVSRLTNDLALLSASVRMASVLLSKPIQALMLLAVVLRIDWRLTLLTLVALPVGVYALSRVAKRIRRAARRAQEKNASLTEVMMQFLSGMRVVKAFACEAFEAEQFARENNRLFRASMDRVRARAVEKIVNETMTSFAALAVLAIGGLWVLDGRMDIAALMAYYFGLARMHGPVREVSELYGDFQESAVGAERVFSLLERRPALRPGMRAELPADTGVRFEDVHFGYRPGVPVLRGLDLAIPAGRTVALIGRTGAGKSTAADLLLRMRDPGSGRVTLGGVPVAEFTFEALRGAVALVNQDSFLFNSTLFDNIAYGTPGADPARVEAAARAAQIHEEILAFPEGYQTIVGERGTNLSGGQRQRIAIARALFKDAPVLVLDEATSSLDAGSERRVQEALATLMAGRTCLVIAHRLSTVRRADAIACLEDGRISAVGTHEEMLGRSPVYAQFVALQTEA